MSAVSAAPWELLGALSEACDRGGLFGERSGVSLPDRGAAKGELGKIAISAPYR